MSAKMCRATKNKYVQLLLPPHLEAMDKIKEEQGAKETKRQRQGAKETKRQREDDAEGYVYVFSNPMYAYHGENVFMIGFSKDPEQYVLDLDSEYPESAEIEYTYKHVNARLLQERVHKGLNYFRLVPSTHFFKCALPVIIEIIVYLASTM